MLNIVLYGTMQAEWRNPIDHTNFSQNQSKDTHVRNNSVRIFKTWLYCCILSQHCQLSTGALHPNVLFFVNWVLSQLCLVSELPDVSG